MRACGICSCGVLRALNLANGLHRRICKGFDFGNDPRKQRFICLRYAGAVLAMLSGMIFKYQQTRTSPRMRAVIIRLPCFWQGALTGNTPHKISHPS